MIRVAQALKATSWRLKAADISSAQLDSELLLVEVLERDRSWLLAHSDETLSENQSRMLLKLAKQRSKRIPMSQLLRSKQFFGLEFEITPEVLAPRPESEQLVELAIKFAPRNSNLLDLGTGSGALAIATANARPDLTLVASDISSAALKVALRNAKKHKQNIKFVKSDLFSKINGRFETIVANLPYLKTNAELMPEARHEPPVALFGGPDGLDLYRRFFKDLPAHLAPGGHVLIESDPWQQADLIELASQSGLNLGVQNYFTLAFLRV